MDGKFGCCYKLRSRTQTDNEMNIIILQLLEIVRIIGNKERRERERETKWCYRNMVSDTQTSYYWFVIYVSVFLS